MRFFFRSKQFKIILIVTAVVISLSVISALVGRYISPGASIAEAIISPFKKIAVSVRNSVEDLNLRLFRSDELVKENDKLKSELAELKNKLVDYESAINDNEFYKEFLEIKENNPDFVFCPALVTAVDVDDEFRGFTLDRGSHNGVELYDPVITEAGLVGYVTELGFSTCKVTTILSPELNCGAYDSRTNDAGAISGNRDFAVKKTTKFFNLSRNCTVAVGDIIVTSGSGIFPDKLIIGTVTNILSDPITFSLYATVEPEVDFDLLKNVMILTHFDGQGEALQVED